MKKICIIILLFSINSILFSQQKIRYVLTHDFELSMAIMTSRAVKAFRILYGDSLLYEFKKDKIICFIEIKRTYDGTLDNIKISGPQKRLDLVMFLERHKNDLTKKLLSSYSCIYDFLPQHISYVKGLKLDVKNNNFNTIIYFPVCMSSEYEWLTMPPAEYLEYISRYEYCRMKTSIDEGIMPESYIWYINQFRKIYGYDNH